MSCGTASSTAFPGRAQPSARASSDRCLSQLSFGCSSKSISVSKEPFPLLYGKHPGVAAKYGRPQLRQQRRRTSAASTAPPASPCVKGVSIQPPWWSVIQTALGQLFTISPTDHARVTAKRMCTKTSLKMHLTAHTALLYVPAYELPQRRACRPTPPSGSVVRELQP